ncbi:MAG: vitamin K epoxide reductase family protein [Actinomycetota bacterium]|nr:vitamin K epoxide reductase family protein [Actinomycetota bacterium]
MSQQRERTTAHGRPARARVLPGWLPPVSLGLSVLGLLLSAYLTFEHFTQNATLACSSTATVNCQKVTESEWSSFLGVPVAVLGLLFFASMVALCLPTTYRRAGTALDVVRVTWCAIGLAFALYLVFAELYHIHAICLWCTGVHVVTFVLLVTLIFGHLLAEPSDD